MIAASARRLTKEIRTPDAICLEILEAMKDICKSRIGSIPPALYSDPNLGWISEEVKVKSITFLICKFSKFGMSDPHHN